MYEINTQPAYLQASFDISAYRVHRKTKPNQKHLQGFCRNCCVNFILALQVKVKEQPGLPRGRVRKEECCVCKT